MYNALSLLLIPTRLFSEISINFIMDLLLSTLNSYVYDVILVVMD